MARLVRRRAYSSAPISSKVVQISQTAARSGRLVWASAQS
jgi:hypothetical protein